jgi:hypothetical protein
MRIWCCLAAIALLAPCAVSAQTTTADGVQALIHGDYASALRILQPLADDAQHPDPIAQFFMATLYHSGRGVAIDLMRACGFYMKAALPGSPVEVQSLALARTIHRDAPPALELCSAARVDVWREPPVTSFALGPDHSVQIDQRGITVAYNGSEKTAAMTLGGFGWVYLPVKFVALDVSRPVETRRYFIEFYVWVPGSGANAPAWTLRWFAMEVAGQEVRQVPGAVPILATAASPKPPAIEVEKVAGLRVNAQGEAERVVLEPAPRTDVIPYNAVR